MATTDAATTAATKAVILARGLGTRMRRADPAAALDADQAAAADAGMKGMIPVGRPFLDHALAALADAGCRDVCLVVGPEHDAVRARYGHELRPRRLRVHFAVQERPLGTADALLAAATFVGDDPFLVVNADNHYPPAVLAALRALPPPALAGFDRDALVRDGNVTAERVASFAVVEAGPDGALRRIVEKPDAATVAALGQPWYVSMNCWLFGPEILDACRRVAPSPRGELELPRAVQLLVDEGRARVRVLPVQAPVLDLSSRGDVAAVAARLAGVRVRL